MSWATKLADCGTRYDLEPKGQKGQGKGKGYIRDVKTWLLPIEA